MLKVQRHKMCLNPLDKVFSVLSLVHRPYPEVFTPDYSKSVQWIYAMVVKTYVETHKDLDVLLRNMPASKYNKFMSVLVSGLDCCPISIDPQPQYMV
jgi:hypothetical protein